MKVVYSVVAPDAIAARVGELYPLEVSACDFWHHGFNDYYRLKTPTGDFLARLYLAHKYWLPDPRHIRFELELLSHLQRSGLRVAAALTNSSGEVLEAFEAPEGQRGLCVFPFARGQVTREPSPTQVSALGHAVASIHVAADAFQTDLPRYRLDESLLLEQPLAQTTAFLAGDRAHDLGRLGELIDVLRTRLRTVSEGGADFGYIHGDVHLGNVLFEDDVPTILDFDHGGFGWRAYDLAPLWSALDESRRALLSEAYRSVRPLDDLGEMPLFEALRWLWNYGDIFAMIDVLGGRGAINDAFWNKYFAKVDELLATDW